MAYNRTKKLTDTSYTPTNPSSEAAIRSQIDGAIQETYDMLDSESVGSSGADFVKTSPIPGLSGNTVRAILNELKAYADTVIANTILGQIPNGTLTDDKLSNDSNQIKSRVSDIALNAKHPPAPLVALKGDGTIEADGALRALCDFAKLNGYSKVFLPTGNYNFRTTNILPNYIEIEGACKADNFTDSANYGDSKNMTIIQWSGGDAPCFTTEAYTNNSKSNRSVTLRNLCFYDSPSARRVNSFMVDMLNASYFTMEDCYMISYANSDTTTLTGVAIRPAPGYTGAIYVNKILKTKFQSAYIYMNCTDSLIDACELWGTDNRKCAIELYNSTDIVVTNNQIVGLIGMIITGGNYHIISNNYFDGSMYDTNYTIQNTGVFISSSDMMQGCIISNNDFWYGKKQAIVANLMFSCTISNNLFCENDMYDVGYNDIEITRGDSVSITGNIFARTIHWDTVTKTKKTASRVNLGRPIVISGVSTDYYAENIVTGNTVKYTSSYLASTLPETSITTANHKHFQQILSSVTGTPKSKGLLAYDGNYMYMSKDTTGSSDWIRISEGDMLPSTADFNTMKKRGTFYYSVIGTVANKPSDISTGNGSLTVKVHATAPNYVEQYLFVWTTMTEYRRTCNNGTWGSWYKFTMTLV